jgi:MFS family permease
VSVLTGVGQIFGAALIGAVAGSLGGGSAGYRASYLFVCLIGVLALIASLRLNDRTAELQPRFQEAEG